ncbi:MAG: helix-turn-helix domain-containing protein [Lawsonibacter sp.]|jgi:transcriptional regulator with XRE-family HTH domain|nr:helix-turn-helix domain-containing protein [Lawsonibacter sp.]
MDQSKTGGLIRALRTQKGLTQKALAEAIGVGDKAVSKWERGDSLT